MRFENFGGLPSTQRADGQTLEKERLARRDLAEIDEASALRTATEIRKSVHESVVFEDPYLDIPRGVTAPNFAGFLKAAGLSLALATSPESSEAQERITLPEHRVVAVEVMGESLVKNIEAAGFIIELQVPAPEPGGPYVIHLGQMHVSPHGELHGRMTNDEVRNFHERKESLLLPLGELGGGVIFDEGLTFTPAQLEQHRTAILQARERIFFLLENGDFTEVSIIREALETVQLYLRFSRDHFVVNTIDGTSVQSLVARAEAAIDDLPDGNDKLYLVGLLGVIQADGSVDQSTVYSGLDSLAPLFMAGRINLAPAEDREANRRGLEAMHALTEITQRYNDAVNAEMMRVFNDPMWNRLRELRDRQDGLTEEERIEFENLRQQYISAISMDELRLRVNQSEIGQEYLEAQSLYNRYAHEERENVVFQMIDRYQLDSGFDLRNVVVRYGNAHDFSAALIDHNLSTNGSRRGLMRLTAQFP